MGQTVKSAVAPVAAAINKGVEGVKEVTKGNVGKGLGEIGGAYVDTVKGGFGISADNKLTLAETGKTALKEFSSDPAGFIAGGVRAYSSGGLSLVQDAGGSILGSLQQAAGGLMPGQLATTRVSPAPQLPSNAGPIYSNGRTQADYTLLFAAIVAGVIFYYRG